jgi:prophage antirepressor-like protein
MALFLRPLFYGGCHEGTLGCAVLQDGTANLVALRHQSLRFAAAGGGSQLLETLTMSHDNSVCTSAPVVSFSFEQSFNVRIVMIDGDPWFVAADVCEALGIANHRDAVIKLDEDEKRAVGLTDAIGREQDTTLINESGLYTLILRCRNATKPGTIPHKFRKWVTGEVIPSIRKTGSYQLPAPEVEKISPKQVQELGRAIDRSLIGWVFNTQDQQQIYNVLHVLLNIRHITDLPASEFDRAMALVAVISEQNHAFLVLVSDLRRDYLKNHLQAGIPWTNHLVREWKKRFKTALPARPDWIEIQRQLRSTESLPETQA